MARKKHLIIGCGPAALSALEKIRALSSEDEAKLVTMDDSLPYCPASLPYLLSGRITEADLWIKNEDYFKSLSAAFVRRKQVIQVLPEKKKVLYQNGASDKYDTLLVASGSEPISASIKGLDEAGIQGFRTLADCRRLLRRLESNKRVAILGAGPVGMKIAAVLLGKGCGVSVIESEKKVLPLYFNEEAEVYIRTIFIQHGARLFIGKKPAAVKRKNGAIRITLSDGSTLDADILINATGVKSRVSFLKGTGVKVSNGILVDRRMRTSVDRIYAAGDVAEAQDFFSGKPKMNAVIAGAVIQGRVAGANMAGVKVEYEGGIPMTVLNFWGNMAFSIGLPMVQHKTGQVLKQKDDDHRRFKKLIFNGDRLIGGMFLNEKIDPGIIRYLIKSRVDMTPHKEALFERTRPLSNPWLRSLKFTPVNDGDLQPG